MTLSLPKTLTAEEWDRNKGTIAKKTGGTTGLTEALKALQQAWARSDWEIAQSHDYSKASTKYKDAAKLWGPAEESEKKLFALAKELSAVEGLAKDISEKWAKSMLVPAASATYVKSVMEAARNELQEVEEKRREIDRFCAAALKLAKQEVNSLLSISKKPMPLNYIGLIKLVREFQVSCLKTPNTSLRVWANNEGKAFLADKYLNDKMDDNQAVLSAGTVKKSLQELLTDLS